MSAFGSSLAATTVTTHDIFKFWKQMTTLKNSRVGDGWRHCARFPPRGRITALYCKDVITGGSADINNPELCASGGTMTPPRRWARRLLSRASKHRTGRRSMSRSGTLPARVCVGSESVTFFHTCSKRCWRFISQRLIGLTSDVYRALQRQTDGRQYSRYTNQQTDRCTFCFHWVLNYL